MAVRIGFPVVRTQRRYLVSDSKALVLMGTYTKTFLLSSTRSGLLRYESRDSGASVLVLESTMVVQWSINLNVTLCLMCFALPVNLLIDLISFTKKRCMLIFVSMETSYFTCFCVK